MPIRVYNTPLPRRHTHQAESDQRSRGSLGISEQRSLRSGIHGARSDISICPHHPLLSRSKSAGTAGHKDGHRRQPPGGASIHLVSWVRSWRRYLPAWAPGASQIRGRKHLDCAMPCPPAPAQFMNTPHRAGQLLRSLEATTFSLKSRGLSKISVGPVSLGKEPGGAPCTQALCF